MAKKSKSKWYQGSGTRALIAVVVIAVFSVVGASRLQGSQAATNGTISTPVETSSYKLMRTSASNGMKQPFLVNETVDTTNTVIRQTVYQLPPSNPPGASALILCNNPLVAPQNTVTVCPTTTTQLIDTGKFLVNHCYVLKAVGGTNPAGGGGIVYEWVSTDCNNAPFEQAFTTSAQTVFFANPKNRTTYMACAFVRRDQTAPTENFNITVSGQGTLVTNRQIAGSTGYSTVCGTSKPVEPLPNGLFLTVRVSNKNAAHALRVSKISLVQLGY